MPPKAHTKKKAKLRRRKRSGAKVPRFQHPKKPKRINMLIDRGLHKEASKIAREQAVAGGLGGGFGGYVCRLLRRDIEKYRSKQEPSLRTEDNPPVPSDAEQTTKSA